MRWNRRTAELGLVIAMLVLGLRLISGAPAATELPIEDAEMVSRAETLDVEQQRYLTYLYARINKPAVARAIGAMVLKNNPSDRQTLLVLASLAAEQQWGEETVRIAEAFLSYYPGDDQGRYFLGAGYYLQGKYSESERELADMKRELYPKVKFPYETDLASASAGAGQWYRAMLSYQELLRHHQLGDELRSEVRREIDRIYREHGPQVYASHDTIRLDGGSVERSAVSHSMHLTERQWWTIDLKEDRVKIKQLQGLRLRDTRRADYSTNIRTLWGARSSSLVGAGYSEEGLTTKAEIKHDIAPQRSLRLSWLGNQTTTDSLLLESLDGRQDKIELAASWLIEADLSLSVRGSMRDVRAKGRTLGDGYGVELSLDQVLRRNGAQWIVGYRGSYASFETSSRDRGLLDGVVSDRLTPRERDEVLRNLVAPEINRHGMGFVTTDNLTRAWSYRIEVGADYDFVLDNLSYNYAMQWVFHPRKSIEIAARGGYFSSASSSNAGSSAYLLDLSFQLYY